MGSVYLADSVDGRTVAVKVIRADLADEPEFRRRFRREVARAQEVPPFCTAEVLDADPEHETPYLVVEYVDGPSLAEVVLDRGPLTPANLYGLAIGVATALSAIHGAGVIHRDLKPSNVLLAPGSPKVIDFGIARGAEGSDGDTRTDQLIGTVAYMAPERLDPDVHDELTAAADVFAWGAVVAFAANGRVPFFADSSPATAVAILTKEPNLDGLAEPLRTLVEQALAKRPQDRPTARKLLDELLSRTPKRVLAAVAEKSGENPILVSAAQNMSTEQAAVSPQPTPQAEIGALPADPTQMTSALRYAHVDVPPPAPTAVLRTASPPAQRRPSDSIGNPPIAHPPTLTGPVRRRGGVLRNLGIAALVVIVIATAATVAGFATGYLQVPGAIGTTSPTLPPTSLSGTGVSPSPQTTPSTEAFPHPLVVDGLASQGKWTAKPYPSFDTTCGFTGGRYVVQMNSVAVTNTLRCQGPSVKVTDFKLSVNVTILVAGSCAGIWFHLSGSPYIEGYAAQICGGYIEVVNNLTRGFAPLDRIALPTPIPLNTPAAISLSDIGGQLTFAVDGTPVGTFAPSVDTYHSGYVGLGILQSDSDLTPPYKVAFDSIEIDGP